MRGVEHRTPDDGNLRVRLFPQAGPIRQILLGVELTPEERELLHPWKTQEEPDEDEEDEDDYWEDYSDDWKAKKWEEIRKAKGLEE